MIIDTHTHIYSDETYKTYFEKADGRIAKAISLACWEYTDSDELIEFVSTKKNLFVVGNIHIDGDIEKQLKLHDKWFQEEKIIGIKMYPGYQYFYPSDKLVYPVAELCQKYNKPLIFHSGDVWNPKGDAILKYSHPIHVDGLAVKYPECKIIIAHFGFPYHLEAANVVSKNKNVYTEISGTLDEMDTQEEHDNLIKQYIADLKRVYSYYPDVKDKTMFGTDYGGEHTPLKLVQPYIKIAENVFTKEEQKWVFSEIAQKLFWE